MKLECIDCPVEAYLNDLEKRIEKALEVLGTPQHEIQCTKTNWVIEILRGSEGKEG
jgi:hypothetical protein